MLKNDRQNLYLLVLRLKVSFYGFEQEISPSVSVLRWTKGLDTYIYLGLINSWLALIFTKKIAKMQEFSMLRCVTNFTI
jgi:hypothetical protein